MASDLKASNSLVNVMINAGMGEFNNGFIDIYDGAQPAAVATDITTQVLLATLRFNVTAFSAPINGVVAANPITTVPALANGNAAWYRCRKADGTTRLIQDSIGVADEGLNLNSVAINAGGNVSITAFTLMLPLT